MSSGARPKECVSHGDLYKKIRNALVPTVIEVLRRAERFPRKHNREVWGDRCRAENANIAMSFACTLILKLQDHTANAVEAQRYHEQVGMDGGKMG